VVVDETSMVGTRDLVELIGHVAAAGGKLVCVGDPDQLPEIDAGGLFAALVHHGQPLTLTGNQRQQHGWERDALLALRAGNIDRALDAYLTHDRIRIGTDSRDAQRQLVNTYTARRLAGADPFQLVALASTRRDVDTLNHDIRAALRRIGLLGPRSVAVTADDKTQHYAVGDLVAVTRNDHGRDLLNGIRATVKNVNADRIDLATEGGGTVTVPAAWAATHLDYGYALTVHKAQGLTTGTALVHGTAALNQQAGYVAMSRGRIDNILFTSAGSLDIDGHDLDVPRFRILDREPRDARDELAQRLARRRDHVLASRQQPQLDHEQSRALHDDLQRQRGRDSHGLSL